jgi:pimeloyl-ACP methyl ester carboxylesterase
MPLTLAAATALMLGLGGHATTQQPVVHRKTVKVGELDIFLREAGPKDAPAILLLQGFPTSSQMFRNLIPVLADRYRVVAPDYVQDYGAPVGYRLTVAHPERVTAIVVQNGNAYD